MEHPSHLAKVEVERLQRENFAKPIPLPEGVTAQEVQAKVDVGLTRTEAIHVIICQGIHDEQAANPEVPEPAQAKTLEELIAEKRQAGLSYDQAHFAATEQLKVDITQGLWPAETSESE